MGSAGVFDGDDINALGSIQIVLPFATIIEFIVGGIVASTAEEESGVGSGDGELALIVVIHGDVGV